MKTMNVAKLPIVLLMMTACFGFSTECLLAGTEGSSDVADQIIALERASFDAWQRKDKRFFETYIGRDATFFMPDDPYLQSDPGINFFQKFTANVDRDKIVDWTMYNPRVQQYGDVAILTYNESATHNIDGQLSSRTLKVSIVFVKRNGNWQLVHEHASANPH